MDQMLVNFKFVGNFSTEEKEFLFPKSQTIGASGFDLASASRQEIEIPPHGRVLIPTGISISLPLGTEAQVRSRSGLALKNGVIVLNSPGTIDADYRGEIKIILFNSSHEAFFVRFGMRIAQMVVAPVLRPIFIEASHLDESLRGEGGFGSTGIEY